jgi:hypothetical protein
MFTTRKRQTSDSDSSATEKTTDVNEQSVQQPATNFSDPEGQVASAVENDVFGNEDGAEVHYKTCEW